MNTYEKLIRLFNTQYSNYPSATLTDEDYNSKWLTEYLSMSGNKLLPLLESAQDRQNDLLVSTLSRYITEVIEGDRTPEQLREYFHRDLQ